MRYYLLLGLTMCLSLSPIAQTGRAGEVDSETVEGAALFDGAARRAQGPVATKPAVPGKTELLKELKDRVTIGEDETPAERAALNAILSRMIDSPSARELAEQFVAEDARATLAFEEIPGTEIYTINGQKTFWTSGGHAHTSYDVPEVNLNSAYMAAQKKYAPGTLAHELLGHSLAKYRASRAGAAAAQDYSRTEEANAGLIGWVVDTELGNKLDDGWAWKYLADPEDYYTGLKTCLPYYAATLSREEMNDPLSAYRQRIEDTDKALNDLEAKKSRYETWKKRIEHFIGAHNMNPDSFKTLKEKISANLGTIPNTETNLKDIKAYLQKLADYNSTEKGKRLFAVIAAQADNPYFQETENAIAKRSQHLADLMKGKSYETEQVPPKAGQLTWDELEALWEKDKASGCNAAI